MSTQHTSLPPAPTSNRRLSAQQAWILAVILVIAASLYLWKFDSFQVGAYMDDAEYVVLAKSIVIGPEYGLVNQPEGVQPTRFPFGWPLILAPVYALFNGDFQSLKMVSFLATIANIAIISLAWKWLGFGKAWIGLATAAVYAFLPMTVSHAGMVMSEVVFLTVVLTCLALSAYLSSSSHPKTVPSLLLGIMWLLAVYVRTIGAIAVIASVVYLLWHRKWRIIAVAIFGFMVALIVVVSVTPIEVSDVIDVQEYQSQFHNPSAWDSARSDGSVLIRAREGINDYLSFYIRDALIPFIGGPSTEAILARFGFGWIPMAISMFVVFFASIGFVLTLRNGFHPSHLYLVGYLAILMVWPWQGERFLYGVVPYLIAYVLIAGTALLESLSRRMRNGFAKYGRLGYRIGALLVVTWCGALVARSALIDRSIDHMPDLTMGNAWIKGNTAPDAVVISEQPLITNLYADRATIGFTDDFAIIENLRCQHPMYLLVAPQHQWRVDGNLVASSVANDMLRTVQLDGDRIELAFDDPEQLVQVLRVATSCE